MIREDALEVTAAPSGTAPETDHPPIWWSIAAVAVFLLVVAGLGTPRFDTNDDAAMLFMASGTAYGEPSPHLVFTHISIGAALTLLYRITDAIPWYGLYLYACMALGLVVLLHVGLRLVRPRTRSGWCIFVAAFTVAPLHMALRPQFTSTSMLVGAAGIGLHLLGLRLRRPLPVHVAGALLLTLSFLIREKSLLAVVLVALPLLVAATLDGPFRDRVARTIVFGGVALALMVTLAAMERAFYDARPDWREYFSFNDARGALHLTPRLDLEGPAGQEVLERVGWTPMDLEMFRSFFFTDRETFSREALEELVAATSDARADVSGPWDLARRLVGQAGYHLALLLLVSAAAAIHLVSRRSRLLVGAQVLWVTAVLGGLLATLRLPARVYVPLIFLAIVAVLLVPGDRRTTEGGTWVRAGSVLAALLAVGFVAQASYEAVQRSDRNAMGVELTTYQARIMNEFDPDGIWVSWSGALALEGIHPLRPVPSEVAALDTVGLGWRSRSPAHDAHLNRLGLGDVALDLTERDDLYIVANSVRHAELFGRYLRERYGRQGHLEPVLDLPWGTRAWSWVGGG